MPFIKEDPKVENDSNVCKRIGLTVETYFEHDLQRSDSSDVTPS